jgi:hypothetical protein
VLQVDDLVEPRPEQIARHRRLVLLRPHPALQGAHRIMDRLTGESQKSNRKVPTLQAIEPCGSKTAPTAEIDSRSSPYQFFTVD